MAERRSTAWEIIDKELSKVNGKHHSPLLARMWISPKTANRAPEKVSKGTRAKHVETTRQYRDTATGMAKPKRVPPDSHWAASRTLGPGREWPARVAARSARAPLVQSHNPTSVRPASLVPWRASPCTSFSVCLSDPRAPLRCRKKIGVRLEFPETEKGTTVGPYCPRSMRRASWSPSGDATLSVRKAKEPSSASVCSRTSVQLRQLNSARFASMARNCCWHSRR